MDPDFPAAHSMDTEWFAVDADGHVGHFYSSEAGAVAMAAQYDRSAEIWERLVETLPRGEARHDLAGRLETGPLAGIGSHHYADRGCTHGALMFLQSLDPVKRYIRAGNASAAPATSGVAVIFRGLSDGVARRLHKDGHCLSCFFHFWFPDLAESERDQVRPADVGLFDYRHPTNNWIAAPYGRQMVPSLPLHIDQLPPDLRALVGAMQFNKLRFAETAHIQPCEWGMVNCWQAAYLSANGLHIREIGCHYADADADTEEYEEFYLDLMAGEREWLKGITIDPPRNQ
jgi:hypothetical protein